jgi:alpha-galactosidase
MIGGDLPSSDAWTTSLLTNPEVISLDQHSTSARPVSTSDRAAVWVSRSTSADVRYVAVFNLTDRTSSLRYSWKELGLDGQSFKLRDLWERRDLGTAHAVAVTVPAHGAVLYAVSSAAEK